MKYYRSRLIDDSNSRVAAYESLLDLFTLVTFILIFAAVIYVARSADHSENSARVVAKIAERGSGTPQTLPRDVLLIVIYRRDGTDKLTITDGTTGQVNDFDVTVDGVGAVLDRFLSTFASFSTINLALYREKEDINPGIFLAISRWLPEHGHKDYRVYFTENQ